LFAGNTTGLYLVGVGMMASFIVMVSGAWLLVVGAGPVADVSAKRQ
jgi:uncharacterized iron-regulated membrane protein